MVLRQCLYCQVVRRVDVSSHFLDFYQENRRRAMGNILIKSITGPTHSGIIPAALKRSNALNQDPSGSISSSKPTPLTFSKLICLSNVK